jgi:hypothetical protein
MPVIFAQMAGDVNSQGSLDQETAMPLAHSSNAQAQLPYQRPFSTLGGKGGQLHVGDGRSLVKQGQALLGPTGVLPDVVLLGPIDIFVHFILPTKPTWAKCTHLATSAGAF